jgi:hypothetical protein
VSDLQKLGQLLSLQGLGFLEVTAIGGSYWMRAGKAHRLLPPLEHLTWEREPLVNVVPLAKPGKYLERVPSSILWVRTETGKAASKLRSFRPAPHVVIREGASVRYVAFWALSDPLEDEWLGRANRRIAHALGAPKKHCGDTFAFHLPGTIMRAGRSRPVPVELVRFEPGVLSARQVVGRLREAPDPDAWRTAGTGLTIPA